MEIEEFEDAIRKDDFAVGDSFWLGDWEFEVVGSRGHGVRFDNDEVVFRWTLTKQEFIQLIIDNHPEIRNPEEFFKKHMDEILQYFGEGFDFLIGEYGANYGTVMNDAIDEVIR